MDTLPSRTANRKYGASTNPLCSRRAAICAAVNPSGTVIQTADGWPPAFSDPATSGIFSCGAKLYSAACIADVKCSARKYSSNSFEDDTTPEACSWPTISSTLAPGAMSTVVAAAGKRRSAYTNHQTYPAISATVNSATPRPKQPRRTMGYSLWRDTRQEFQLPRSDRSGVCACCQTRGCRASAWRRQQ